MQESRIAELVRGTRRIRRDARERRVEVIKADGERVCVEYDASGAVQRVDARDAWFETRLPRASEPTVHVLDARGTTEVVATDDGWSIAREGARLGVQSDAEGRPVRVCIPGSRSPLEFRYSGRGCVLQYEGRALARLVEMGDRVRWRVGSFVLERSGAEPRWTLSARNVRNGSSSEVVVWTDLLYRTARRVWNDGFEESFSRDTLGRLAETRSRDGAAGEWQTRKFRYFKSELVEVVGDAGVCSRKTDGAGRVVALIHPDGRRIDYEYDARGRRTLRIGAEGITRYSYDGLDRLVRVDLPGGEHVAATYDGLGRRIETRWEHDVARVVRHEHRDAGGRLWAVTDGEGKVLATYVWYDDTPLLHFHGSLDAPGITAYVCDPHGTPLMAATVDSHSTDQRVERLPLPPYGRADSASAPTIYGHFADPHTRLIHFGARDFDPETQSFLTPEPWHGGADDERRLGGATRGSPGWVDERGAAHAHDYALCRFDPVGRVDYDGHSSFLRGLGNVILGPIWGMPLTSVSLFLMMPANLYLEVFARIVQVIPGLSHPWKKHSIFSARGYIASSRQGQISFALNGFFPRALIAGLGGDRAITIGNVIWLRRHELNVMNRPTVVEVEDLAGTGGGTAFNRDPGKSSVLQLEVTDSGGKLKIHTVYWTRGFGNTLRVAATGTPPVETLSFEDDVADGKRTGSLILSHPFPYEYNVPTSRDSSCKLFLREMLHDASTQKHSTAEVLDNIWIALKVEHKKRQAKLKNGDAIEVEAPGGIAAAHVVVGRVDDQGDDFALALLFGSLPARFQTANVAKDMVVHCLIDDASVPATGDWQPVGTSKNVLEASEPAAGSGKPWPPDLSSDALLKIKAATAATIATIGFPSPPPFDTAHARLVKLVATLEVADALPAGLTGAVDVVLQQSKGKVQTAKLKDITKPLEVEFVANPDGIAANDRVAVRFKPAGATAEVETYARIDTLTGKAAKLVYLMPQPTFTAPLDMKLQKLVDRAEKDTPKGTTTAPTGTQFEVEVKRFKAFDKDALIYVKSGAVEALRKVKRIAKAKLEFPDDVIGTQPFTVSLAKRDPSRCCIKGVTRPDLLRFLRRTAGDPPTTYGTYPAFLLEVSIDSRPHPNPQKSAFYVQAPAASPPALHDRFKLTWKPLQFGADEYFILDSDLPIVRDDSHFAWSFDPDEPEPREGRLHRLFVNPPFTVQVREFQASGTERGRPDSLVAHSGEVLVPAEPKFRHTLGDSLAEHELHHTVQGNHWGLLLNALPLQGLLLSATDLKGLRDEPDAPGWFRDFFDATRGDDAGSNWMQIFSYGGIMRFFWQYAFLSPLRLSDDATRAIVEKNFNFWNRLFNPFWGYLIGKFPSIDPTRPIQDGNIIEILVRLIARASDLRMWTPFTGLIPTLMANSPQNFIEQGASRMSGDLYSTILTADDGFNANLRLRFSDALVGDDTDANVEKPMGSVFRLMMFPTYRSERTFLFDRADQPASVDGPVVQNVEKRSQIDGPVPTPASGATALVFPETHPVVEIRAPKDTLFHPALYELRNISVRRLPATTTDELAYAPPAAPAVPPTIPTPLKILGPPSNPTAVEFLVFPDPAVAGNERVFMQPKLRNLVPMPPHVIRSAGLYFIPAHPAVYNCESYSPDRNTDEFAKTQNAKLTVSGTVSLGKEIVDWVHPTADPGVPTAPQVDVFVTESLPLVMKQKGGGVVPTKGFEQRFDVVTGPALNASLTLQPSQWDFVAGDAAAKLRIRLYRIVRKNDRTDDTKNDPAFDLQFKDVPQLKNVRSYLEKDIWMLVRDFIVEVQALPALAAQTIKHDAFIDVEMPLEVDAAAIVVTPPAGAPRFPSPEKKQPATAFKRGRVWRFGPLKTVIEDNVVYPVEVTFGKAHTVKRNFNITVEPAIRLTSTGAFEATTAAALELTIQGGTAAYTLDVKNLPTGAQAQLDATTAKVKITVTTAPPSAVKVEVNIKDRDGKQGRRTVTVK